MSRDPIVIYPADGMDVERARELVRSALASGRCPECHLPSIAEVDPGNWRCLGFDDYGRYEEGCGYALDVDEQRP